MYYLNNNVNRSNIFLNKCTFDIPKFNLKIAFHHNNLNMRKLEQIKDDMVNTFLYFKKYFSSKKNKSEDTFELKLNIFNNKNEYFAENTGNVANICLDEYTSTLQDGLINSFLHHATKGNTDKILPVLKEDIISYVKNRENPNITQENINYVKSQDVNLSEILNIHNQNTNVSKVGHALVTFLEEQNPYLIESIFSAIRRGKNIVLDNLFKKVNENDQFSDWLSSKTFEPHKSHPNDEVSQDTFFSKVEIIKIPGYRFEIELYHNTLDKQKIEKFRSDIISTFIDFQESFNFTERNVGPHKFRCHVFDSIESYKKDGSKIFNLPTEKSVGLTFSGNDKYVAEIYLGQCPGDSRILKHEMAHGLTFYAMGKGFGEMPTAIMEGIASFIEHKGDLGFNNQQIEKIKSLDLSPSKIYELTYKDGKKTYEAGHVLVMFLEEKAPNLIDRVLQSLRYGNHTLIEKVFEDELKHYERDFSDWLDYKINNFKTSSHLLDSDNNIEERIIYPTDNTNDYQFSTEQSQNDYQNSIAAEYYL